MSKKRAKRGNSNTATIDVELLNNVTETQKAVVASLERLDNAMQKLANTSKKTSTAQKKQEDSYKKLADGLKRYNAQLGPSIAEQNSQSAAFLRTARSAGEFEKTVSSIRNKILIYTFAVRPMINVMKEATTAFLQFERGITGVERMGEKFNISANDIKMSIQAITNDGLLDFASAATAMKNILATGIGLPKAIQLLDTFKNSAAFGRQGTLSLSEAVVGASDGFKNMMSRMLDNAGITKNADMILREMARSYGKSVDQLTEFEKHMLLANGLIKEGSLFMGDANRLSGTLAGQFDRLSTTIDKASRAIGSMLNDTGLLNTFLSNLNSALATAIRLQDMFKPEDVQNVNAAMRAGAPADVLNKYQHISAQAAFQRARVNAARMPIDQPSGGFLGDVTSEYAGMDVAEAGRTYNRLYQIQKQYVDNVMAKNKEAENIAVRQLQAYQDARTQGIWWETMYGTRDPANAEEAINSTNTLINKQLGYYLEVIRARKEIESLNSKDRGIGKLAPSTVKAPPVDFLSDFQTGRVGRLEGFYGQYRSILDQRDRELARLNKEIESKSKQMNIPVDVLTKTPEYQHYVELIANQTTAALQRLVVSSTRDAQERARKFIENEILPNQPDGRKIDTRRVKEPKLPDYDREVFPELVKMSKLANGAADSFSTMSQAASMAGREVLYNYARRANLAANSTAGLIDNLKKLRESYALLGNAGESNLLNGLGVFGGAIGVIGGVVGIASSLGLFNDKDKANRDFNGQQGRGRSGSNRIGASISRGPQTVNINPTIVANADHDIYFADDGIDIAADNMVRAVQQAIDTGEISLDRI